MDNINIGLINQDVQKIVQNLNKNDIKTRTAIQAALGRNLLRIETNAKINSPVNTGRLKNSIYHTVDNLYGFVKANADYAYDVEHGKGPGEPPPFKDIEYWFLRKNKIPLSKGKKYYPVINAIRYKIARNGTKPQPFLIPAWETYLQKFYQECKEAINETWT